MCLAFGGNSTVGDFVGSPSARLHFPYELFFPYPDYVGGLVVVFRPWGSAEYVVIILGITSMFYGITDLISQYGIHKMRKHWEEEEQKKKLDGDRDIEDTDYEEVK